MEILKKRLGNLLTVKSIVTIVLTVVFDLVVAIGAGLVLASLLFIKRMADVTEAHRWTDFDDEATDPDHIQYKKIPARTKVYEINGPMFFAASEKYQYMLESSDFDVLVIRMRNVPAIDAAGVEVLSDIVRTCKKNGIQVVFSHVNEQPMHAMEKAGLKDLVGAENFCPHIDPALLRAAALVKEV